MKVVESSLPGVKIVVPDVFGDARGWFCEQYNAERYRAAGIVADFVQDNESMSAKGVVRGLHWQAGARAQAKLVRVVRGAAWDVAVDIRRGSPTFGQHMSVVLTGENRQQLFIPRGFAHGFVVLEDDTLFAYKCDNFYCPEAERGLMFNDPALDIKWPETDAAIRLSEKDQRHPRLAEIEPWSPDEERPATRRGSVQENSQVER